MFRDSTSSDCSSSSSSSVKTIAGGALQDVWGRKKNQHPRKRIGQNIKRSKSCDHSSNFFPTSASRSQHQHFHDFNLFYLSLDDATEELEIEESIRGNKRLLPLRLNVQNLRPSAKMSTSEHHIDRSTRSSQSPACRWLTSTSFSLPPYQWLVPLPRCASKRRPLLCKVVGVATWP